MRGKSWSRKRITPPTSTVLEVSAEIERGRQRLSDHWFSVGVGSLVAPTTHCKLGTYLSSNKGRTLKALQMLFICGVAAAVLLIGWFLHPAGGGLGDPAWGRLEKFPQPDNFTWVYLLPPIAVLALTQWGRQ